MLAVRHVQFSVLQLLHEHDTTRDVKKKLFNEAAEGGSIKALCYFFSQPYC